MKEKSFFNRKDKDTKFFEFEKLRVIWETFVFANLYNFFIWSTLFLFQTIIF